MDTLLGALLGAIIQGSSSHAGVISRCSLGGFRATSRAWRVAPAAHSTGLRAVAAGLAPRPLSPPCQTPPFCHAVLNPGPNLGPKSRSCSCTHRRLAPHWQPTSAGMRRSCCSRGGTPCACVCTGRCTYQCVAAWLLVLSLIALHNNVRPRLHDAPACCAQQHHPGCACLAAAGQGISGAGQAHIARQGPTQPALLRRSKTWASMSFDPEALKVRVGASAQQCDGADRTPAGIAGVPILLTFPIFYLLQKRVVQQQKGSRIEEVQVQVGGRERGLIWCCSQYVAAALISVCAQPVWNEGANHPAPLQVTFHMYPKILVSLLPRHLSFKAGPFARLSAMFFAWLQCKCCCTGSEQQRDKQAAVHRRHVQLTHLRGAPGCGHTGRYKSGSGAQLCRSPFRARGGPGAARAMVSGMHATHPPWYSGGCTPFKTTLTAPLPPPCQQAQLAHHAQALPCALRLLHGVRAQGGWTYSHFLLLSLMGRLLARALLACAHARRPRCLHLYCLITRQLSI